MQYVEMHRELLKLGACREVAELALQVAKGARAIASGVASAVFLLDRGNEQLALSASDCQRGISVKNKSIPASLLDDPLCFCMQAARPCKVSLYPGISSFQSVDCVQSGGDIVLSWASALPLSAPGQRTIGAVLLVGDIPGELDNAALELYCLYAAAALHTLMEQQRMQRHMASLEKDLTQLSGGKAARPVRERKKAELIGQSDTMRTIRRQLEQVALSPAPVLLAGETGTGKGVAARFIHENSRRATAPFIEVNCGALPANLLESELFGHVKGAFTGADSEHPGLFRSAHGGTIFLDEIGELPINLQTVLLHVLEDKCVRPVGGIKSYNANVRIIAATNMNLQQAIEQGRFRLDLYHRIATVVVSMPALNARVADIPTLAAHFLEEVKQRYARPELTISPKALQYLTSRRYMGNIRELAGCIETAVMLCEPGAKELLPVHFETREVGPSQPRLSLPDYLAGQEAMLISSTMRLYGGSIQKSAEALGVPRRTLARKVEKYAIAKAGAEPCALASIEEKEA